MQVARQGLVFDTLTEVAADGTLRGELATGWTASEDARLWTFDLRRDVNFHDGAPFTAEDVVASAAGFPDGRYRPWALIRSPLILNASDPALPMRLSQPEFYISAAHAMDEGIGTGLYRVKSFSARSAPADRTRRAHYKDGTAGWFDEVELTSIPAEPVRGQALAEYLVDAVDVTDAEVLGGIAEVDLQPNRRQPTQAVSKEVAQPAQVSHLRPLDNLRAAERWWFGLTGVADSGLRTYMPFNSGAFGSTPDAPPKHDTGRAPVFLCPKEP